MGSVRAAIARRFMPALAIGALVLLPGTSHAQLSGLGPAASFGPFPGFPGEFP